MVSPITGRTVITLTSAGYYSLNPISYPRFLVKRGRPKYHNKCANLTESNGDLFYSRILLMSHAYMSLTTLPDGKPIMQWPFRMIKVIRAHIRFIPISVGRGCFKFIYKLYRNINKCETTPSPCRLHHWSSGLAITN